MNIVRLKNIVKNSSVTVSLSRLWALRGLLHPEFAERDHETIGPTPIDWPSSDPTTELVVVDQLQRLRELRHVARLLRGGHTLIVASHLHSAWVRLFNMKWPAEHFYTDRSTDKLQPLSCFRLFSRASS